MTVQRHELAMSLKNNTLMGATIDDLHGRGEVCGRCKAEPSGKELLRCSTNQLRCADGSQATRKLSLINQQLSD
jgi:hypothetical protein